MRRDLQLIAWPYIIIIDIFKNVKMNFMNIYVIYTNHTRKNSAVYGI